MISAVKKRGLGTKLIYLLLEFMVEKKIKKLITWADDTALGFFFKRDL